MHPLAITCCPWLALRLPYLGLVGSITATIVLLSWLFSISSLLVLNFFSGLVPIPPFLLFHPEIKNYESKIAENFKKADRQALNKNISTAKQASKPTT
ncbi:hypothetical protein F4861DRAFT_526740 [Xylaria intraflava]|nr:hypothetical protein F4861DRAFT_526740 [Xylaria intraflava]